MNNREQITLLDGRIDRDPYPAANWTETLTDSPRYIANKPKYYDVAGEITAPTKIWTALVDPDTGDGYSIDISEAEFSTLYNVLVTVNKSTGTAADVPTLPPDEAPISVVPVDGLAPYIILKAWVSEASIPTE